ncbi:MAG: hypothetical protein U0840_06555 [Gemmataceae bacterium]
MRWMVTGCLLFVIAGLAGAQETRFELGQRLRLLERAIDQHGSEEARKRALEPLEQATPTFFRGQLAEAAGLLDRARLLLPSAGPITPEMLWAESLVVRPARRLVDTSGESLVIRVERFYKVSASKPDKTDLRLMLVNRQGKSVVRKEFPLGEPPVEASLSLRDLAEGDYTIRAEVLVAGTMRARSEQTLSVVQKLNDRLAHLRQLMAGHDGKASTVESATLERLLTILGDLQAGRTAETNYPAARLLAEAESVAQAHTRKERFYTARRAGQFWLGLPVTTRAEPVRVQVPRNLDPARPVPLVVALHGAGGSENMFFDGYGDGLVAKLCEKKGWLLVTTRSPLFSFAGGPDVLGVIDSLAKLYPVDMKRVVLIGHSMGAAQAVSFAGRSPDRFLAVAALGGGGGFKASEGVKKVRFFVGCGERDFALTGAKNLHRNLQKAGIATVLFKTYPHVEHLLIVQLALPEVFQFFEDAFRG